MRAATGDSARGELQEQRAICGGATQRCWRQARPPALTTAALAWTRTATRRLLRGAATRLLLCCTLCVRLQAEEGIRAGVRVRDGGLTRCTGITGGGPGSHLMPSRARGCAMAACIVLLLWGWRVLRSGVASEQP